MTLHEDPAAVSSGNSGPASGGVASSVNNVAGALSALSSASGTMYVYLFEFFSSSSLSSSSSSSSSLLCLLLCCCWLVDTGLLFMMLLIVLSFGIGRGSMGGEKQNSNDCRHNLYGQNSKQKISGNFDDND